MIHKLIACLVFGVISTTASLSARTSGPRVVYIGDSITDGNWGDGGGAKPSDQRNHWDQNHLFGSGYMYLCAAHYQGFHPEAGVTMFNRGISGNTLADLEWRWTEDALDLRPDVLSVLVGVNDVHGAVERGAAFDPAEWESRYRRLLDRAREHNPLVRLVLGAPFSSRPAYAGMVEECSRIVERIAADYDAVFLPYDAMFAELFSRYPDVPAAWWLWDGIHPTAAGHGRMAEMWIEKTGRFWE